MELAQSFSVTGSANSTVEDTGLASTEAEHKHCKKVLVYLSGIVANKIQLWLEREKLAEYYDYHFATVESTGSTNVQKGSTLLHEIPVDVDIPVGQTLKVALQCGATAKNLFGSYVFDLV